MKVTGNAILALEAIAKRALVTACNARGADMTGADLALEQARDEFACAMPTTMAGVTAKLRRAAELMAEAPAYADMHDDLEDAAFAHGCLKSAMACISSDVDRSSELLHDAYDAWSAGANRGDEATMHLLTAWCGLLMLKRTRNAIKAASEPNGDARPAKALA